MSELQKRDFNYGAALSVLINNGLNPILVEYSETKRIYKVGTDDSECILYMKCASLADTAWIFNIEKDIDELKEYLNSGKKMFLALICVVDSLNKGEIAFLNDEEIKLIIELGKKSIRISRGRSGNYRVSTGKKKEEYISVKYNRFNELK